MPPAPATRPGRSHQAAGRSAGATAERIVRTQVAISVAAGSAASEVNTMGRSPRSAAASRCHHRRVHPDQRGEVGLVDHEQVRTGDTGSALARHLVPAGHVDDEDLARRHQVRLGQDRTSGRSRRRRISVVIPAASATGSELSGVADLAVAGSLLVARPPQGVVVPGRAGFDVRCTAARECILGLERAELDAETSVESGGQRGQRPQRRFSPPPRIWLTLPGETPMRAQVGAAEPVLASAS